MKILWMKSDYLHPTTRGGQIRTLGMLRCLHQRHEIHYVCLDDGLNTEGALQCSEYCTRAYPVRHSVPPRGSLRFAAQLARGIGSKLPVSVARYRSAQMKEHVATLLASQPFDSLVCDFLFPAPNVPDLSEAVLFQHNVETVIWKRHAAHADNPLSRAYLSLQASKMEQYERAVCRQVHHVVAVSDVDRLLFERDYGIANVSTVPTGVDTDYFAPPDAAEPKADLVFVGSMDWLPNVDGAKFFIEKIYPSIQSRIPSCKVAFVGRRPEAVLNEAANVHPNLMVTGTVDDVRPWLWGAGVSMVPLRIGGGTRLKIFEAMAAEIPVVSTSVGAEGLPVHNGRHLLIEDDPQLFADACVDLLLDRARRKTLAAAGRKLVSSQFSWDAAARKFEDILSAHPLRPGAIAATHTR